jgi:putative membrane-bound dehydrogenase-like protein
VIGQTDNSRTIPQANDAPKALSPEESRKCFHLPPGFDIECVAAEPDLTEPTGITFDAQGRIYVAELHGYNLDGYYDIVELNKSGVLDKAIRRIPAAREAEERATKETYGTVRLLDTDAQGRVVRSQVFADRLPPCYGVVAARDGVIALCAPDIIYLGDPRGSGRAEIKEVLFTGFGLGEIWSRISNPRWGLDNWIYAAAGMASGGTIRGSHLKNPVKLGNTCFRFRPDGSKLEAVSGGTSGFGLAFDDWGDRFLCTNQQHALYVAPLPYSALARNPYYASVDPVVNICTYGHPARLFPTSKPDPWRLKRSQEPAWVKFYGSSETDAGLFTSACSPCIYQADLFSEAYRGNHFSCEPAQNLIHRCLLEPNGAGFAAKRAADNREFLTSTDRWFRPVNLTVGPEGALYVVDMYREIIEDYSAIPRYLQQQYVESLRHGRDRGRIWRLVPVGKQINHGPILAKESAKQLVAELGSPNVWRRLTAQQLLIERGDRTMIPTLTEMAREGKTPQARLHALYSLKGLEALQAVEVVAALGDSHYGVRLAGLHLAEPMLDTTPTVLAAALELAKDDHPKVRLQLAFTLGASKDDRTLKALASLAQTDGQDRWMQAAILSSVATRADRLAEAVLGSAGQKYPSLLQALAAVVGTRNEEQELTRLLKLTVGEKGEHAEVLRLALLSGLVEGLGRNPSKRASSTETQKLLEQFLVTSTGAVQKKVLQVSGLINVGDLTGFRAFRQAAMRTAVDRQKPIEERLASLSALDRVPTQELSPLQELLDARQPLDLQLAAVQLFGSGDGPQVVEVLLRNWQKSSPRVQTAILDAICSRKDRLPLLLDALQRKTVDAADLPALRQTQLLENPDAAIRRRAAKLFAARTSDDRRQVLEKYRAALTLPRDIDRGRAVFEKQCMKCHQLNGRGSMVGPDLAAVQNRPDESLLADILDPSAVIVAGFKTYTVATKNGKIYTGVLTTETATSVTLRHDQGADDILLRKDIEEMQASSKSLMPEGMEKEIPLQDMADLIGYLRFQLRSSPGQLTLFDGAPGFLKALDEGAGKAVLAKEELFAGKAALRVSPPQRFSARIPGWSYRIAEKPGTGEFRYLRLAWKSQAGTGIMLELADGGAWPREDDARGRLYSGRNTTGWKAVQVSDQVPREWVVVTRDLWKEFGPMTLTGIAPTAMGGDALFARIELLRSLDEQKK